MQQRNNLPVKLFTFRQQIPRTTLLQHPISQGLNLVLGQRFTSCKDEILERVSVEPCLRLRRLRRDFLRFHQEIRVRYFSGFNPQCLEVSPLYRPYTMLHQFLDQRETRRQPIDLLVQLSQNGEMRSKFDINKPAQLRQILVLVPGKVVFDYEDAVSDTVEVPKIPRPNRSRIHQDH